MSTHQSLSILLSFLDVLNFTSAPLRFINEFFSVTLASKDETRPNVSATRCKI